MHQISRKKVAVTFAVMLGGIHLVWSVLVALGWAESILDFIYRLHMITPMFFVDSFSLGMAISLIVFTTAIGYVIGYVFATIWNHLHK